MAHNQNNVQAEAQNIRDTALEFSLEICPNATDLQLVQVSDRIAQQHKPCDDQEWCAALITELELANLFVTQNGQRLTLEQFWAEILNEQ